MTAEKRLALFQNKKHEFDTDEWSVVSENEKTIVLTDRKEEMLYTLSYLEEETNHFIQLEPSLTTSFITRLTDEKNESDEVEMEGEIEGRSFRITLHMDNAMNGEEIEVYGYVHSDDVISSNTSAELKRIYKQFQHVMGESSLYRLYFVASELTFQEELTIFRG